MIRVIIHLDDLLIWGNGMKEIFMAMVFVIFLLHYLGFVIPDEMCVDPKQETEFLGLIVNSQILTLSLPAERIGKIKDGNRGITSGFNKTNRSLFFNNLSSAPSPSTVSLLTTTANCICEANTALLHFRKADSMGNGLLCWVKNLKLCSSRLVITTTGTGPYSYRCIPQTLVSYLSRDQNRG